MAMRVMECQELERSELAARYLNGQLDPGTQDQLELHILECPACQQTLEVLEAIRDELAVHADEIRAYSPRPRRYLGWAWIAITGFVVVAGAVGVRQVLVHREGHGPVVRKIRSEVPSSLDEPRKSDNPELTFPLISNSGAKVAAENHRGVPARLSQTPKGSAARIRTESTDAPDNSSLDAGDPVNYSNGNPNLQDSTQAVERNSGTVGQATAEGKPEEKTVAPIMPQPASSFDFSGQIAKLATVRPFPYTFAGISGSQASAAGSARAQQQPESERSENPGNSAQTGATGFNSARDYFRSGMAAYVGREYETAVNLLTHAVMLEPDFSEANLYLGISKLLRGSPSEAASALQIAAQEKKPALAQAAHFFLAKAYLQLGKLADAESEFGAAAALPGRLAGKSNQIMQELDDIRSESAGK